MCELENGHMNKKKLNRKERNLKRKKLRIKSMEEEKNQKRKEWRLKKTWDNLYSIHQKLSHKIEKEIYK